MAYPVLRLPGKSTVVWLGDTILSRNWNVLTESKSLCPVIDHENSRKVPGPHAIANNNRPRDNFLRKTLTFICTLQQTCAMSHCLKMHFVLQGYFFTCLLDGGIEGSGLIWMISYVLFFSHRNSQRSSYKVPVLWPKSVFLKGFRSEPCCE